VSFDKSILAAVLVCAALCRRRSSRALASTGRIPLPASPSTTALGRRWLTWCPMYRRAAAITPMRPGT
jgi:hypothetical protein